MPIHPLFRILPVTLHHGESSQTVYAFIDEGSSYSLMDEKIAKELKVKGPNIPLRLQWTGNVTRAEPDSEKIRLNVSGKGKSQQYRLENVRTVRQLILPIQSVKYSELSRQFPHLKGLPVEDYEDVQPQLLIGLDNLRLCVPIKLREGTSADPIAAMCRLGWSIYGDSEKRSKILLKDTTRRLKTVNGFEIGLLWNTDSPEFPDSYPMAARRLEYLVRKFKQNPELESKVRETIEDYERNGYAHKATLEELTSVEANRIWRNSNIN
uniref:Peptidase aspartic putative domain-containing protein n=1 Tax=Anopheles dirus TaxID=7168 RepID=A0A182NQ39_9DIPT